MQDATSTAKAPNRDMARVALPEATLERLGPRLAAAGITRVANLTGLDRVGIPVVAVFRPNSRSYSVAQGKGLSLAAAKASGLMEAIENFHAEEAVVPLVLGRASELRRRYRLASVAGLPRLATSVFHDDYPILWANGAVDLVSGEPLLVPYELISLDFRAPRPAGFGCFLGSSNGLASGNHPAEARAHALCEVIERDANALFHVAGRAAQDARRLDLSTVDDPACRALLEQFERAGIAVLAWDTTTDVRVASIMCNVVDLDPDVRRPMPPVRGSGTHPARRIALSRALTEAAQGRLTRISGSRDDLANVAFDEVAARRAAAERREELARPAARSFADMCNAETDTVDADLAVVCNALQEAGLKQLIAYDLTRSDFEIPVVRVVVPQLEAGSEFPGYAWGQRARRIMELGS